MFEKDGEMEINSRLNALNNWYYAGLERTKAKIITGKPNAKLTHIQNVHKNTIYEVRQD